jgi:hypothetical protein
MNFKKQLERVLHIHDSPERTSLAFSVGIFFGFSPFIGLHTVLALLAAFVFRLNRVAALVGVYVNNPWTLIPVAVASTSLGVKVLGHMGYKRDHFDWAQVRTFAFWTHFPSEFQDHCHTLFPFFVGSMICAVVLAILSYPLCLWFIRTYRHRIHHDQK